MNRVIVFKYAVLAALISLFGGAAWLFSHSQVDTESYQQHIAIVVEIENKTASLIQQLLLVQNGEVTHFDKVASLELELEIIVKNLTPVHAEMNDLLLGVGQVLKVVSHIKAMYAIYKNSSLYFPKGTQLLLSHLSEMVNKPLIIQLKDFERQVLLFAANHNTHFDKQTMLGKINLLRLSMTASANFHHEEMLQLLKHGEKLVRVIDELNVLNKVLLENNIPQLSQHTIASLDAHFDAEVYRATEVKRWFFISIAALIILVMVIWIKQRASLNLLKQNTEDLSLAGSVFRETHEGILITDGQQAIVDVNPAFTDITGYSRDEVIGKTPKLLSSGKQSSTFYDDMWTWLSQSGFWKGEIWNRDKSGRIYAQLLTISAIKNDLNEVINYVGIFSDVTVQKKQHEQLDLMAHYDVLTKLPNRALFSDRFTQAIAHSKRTETLLAVCFVDLDNFKPVNDKYGHEVGDQLLIQVAERIQACIREEDTVSRQGGDEFVLLLGDIQSFEVCQQTLQRIHDALSRTFIIDGVAHKISASSGMTLYPADEGDIDTLLRHADHAMYLAKQAGRNRFHLFNPKQDQEAAHKHKRINVIEKALENNEFVLFYQPKVDMLAGVVIGVEALIRWIHPEKGLIPPIEFLPIIAGTDVEITLGDWVIEQALIQIQAWNQQGINLDVSVNIASHHLLSEHFCSQLSKTLSKYPSVDSQSLELEILESSALGDLNVIRSILKSCLHDLGVKIALDDFGTGYSSLTHLRNLPVNTIKIDQSFVRDMLDDINDYVIIDSVIALAASFGRAVIAEGVETTEQGSMLILMGCPHAQGYAISRPLPAEELVEWLSSYKPNSIWQSLGNVDVSEKEKKKALFELVSEHWRELYMKKYTNI